MKERVASGIIETARALGMDPIDLATIISYETAGTFDPAKAGPTTQWGQHKGLIQFGEPQAREYGVDWSDPLGSQLGADGAIARYYRDNGWQPGMGLLDAYSIVNAGGPGRYGASDANNGGAPGTVADKVNNQMAGHRDKAMGLLGMGAGQGLGYGTDVPPMQNPISEGGPAPAKPDVWGLLAEALTGAATQGVAPPEIAPRAAAAPYAPVRRQNPYAQFLASLGR